MVWEWVSAEKISSTIRNPGKLRQLPDLVQRDLYRSLVPINAWWSQFRRRDSGVDIMSQDWDTLLILDGARYDLFSVLHKAG